MEAIRSGETTREETFRRFVEEYQTPLLRMCCIYLRDRTLAEDAVQETFLKAFRGMDAFRGDCSETTWLMRIAINTCHDMQRSGWFRHVERRITPDMLPEPGEAPTESETEVVEEIMKLPPKLREAVLLYYYQNMTVYEIAEVLSIDHSSVSSRLKRAKEKLRTAMKGAYFYE